MFYDSTGGASAAGKTNVLHHDQLCDILTNID